MEQVRWPGRSRSRAMSFEQFRRCAQDTKAVKLRAMTQLAFRPKPQSNDAMTQTELAFSPKGV